MMVFVFDPAGRKRARDFRFLPFDTSGKTPAFCDDGVVREPGPQR